MELREVSELIKILKKENETNSKEDREFNNEWIKLLCKSCADAIKEYSIETSKLNTK